LSEELASTIVKKKKYSAFDRLVKKYKKVKPTFIAATLINTPKEIKKRYNIEPKIDEKTLEKIFDELNKGKISKEAVFEILLEISKGKKLNLKKYELMSDAELKKQIKKIVKQNKGMPLNALIGKAMGKLRGKADGKKVVEILKKQVK
jgi:glutamyl-tRNA(Gln) amidotransferase subunit E